MPNLLAQLEFQKNSNADLEIPLFLAIEGNNQSECGLLSAKFNSLPAVVPADGRKQKQCLTFLYSFAWFTKDMCDKYKERLQLKDKLPTINLFTDIPIFEAYLKRLSEIT